MAENKVWKVIDLINWGKDYLAEKNIPESRLNIEYMLCKVINCKRFDLYLIFDKPLKQNELSLLKEFIRRRICFEPLQYILGETEFYALNFKLTKDVLIPRPETEILVDECIKYSKQHFSNYEKTTIFDIGTGSGCIAVSLAKNIDNSQIFAVDINKECIEIAFENAKLNSVEDKIQFEVLDILSDSCLPDRMFDIIVSNPPYIEINAYKKLQPEIVEFEPKNALTDYSNGLTFYKKIARVSRNILKKNGIVFVEIAYNQGEQVKKIFQDQGYKNILIKKDYSNLDRVLLTRLD